MTSTAAQLAPAAQSVWRAPTAGEKACGGCRAAACYGHGNAWYCRACVPHGFLPRDRAPGQ